MNPADIPLDGRYDFTIIRSSEKPNESDDYPFVAVVDNGPFRGKRVTGRSLRRRAGGTRFSADLRAEFQAMIDGKYETVERTYTASNPRIRYRLSNYGSPAAASEITRPDPRAKFRR